MAYENIITTLPDHPKSLSALLSSVKERQKKGGAFNHVVLDKEGKNIAIKIPLGSTVLNLIMTMQMNMLSPQKKHALK